MNTEQMAEGKSQEMRAQPTARTKCDAGTTMSDDKMIKLPLLKSGARLTQQEFERRYHAMPHVKKAELIEGVVRMGSPVRYESHSKPHSRVITWLGVYWAATPGVHLGDNGTVRLDIDNEVQPDAFLRLEPADGGNSKISDDDYVEGAPELIVEVAASSAAYDLYDKFEVYRRSGVQEYIIWQTRDNLLYWFRLYKCRTFPHFARETRSFGFAQDRLFPPKNLGEYLLIKPDADGVLHSEIFPGLNLAVNKLLKGDLAEVLSVLQNGLSTDEHATFVESLSENSR